MGDQPDIFFAELLTRPEPAATSPAATGPVVVDADDEWFEGAARDTLIGETSASPRDAVGAAALALERELMGRPARRRPVTSTARTTGQCADRRGRVGAWAIAAIALVVAVLAVALLANPATQRSADHGTPRATSKPASAQAPASTTTAGPNARPRDASAPSESLRRSARRPRRATAATKRQRPPAARRRSRASTPARAPASASTSARQPHRAVAASPRPPRARSSAPAFTPGDLPSSPYAP